jgi:hypothetical protein
MSKYASILYHGGIYGESPKLGYSVEPMSLEIDSFISTTVYWQSPVGNFSRIRVVRNQSGFAETAEDGVIIFEQSSIDGSSIQGLITTNYFRDGIDNPTQIPLLSGREVYYRVFLFTIDKVWVTAGSIHGVIPRDTNVTKRMVDLLPRVLTSQELSPLGVIDPDSHLYKFLDGLAFTYEQLLTNIELIRPGHAVDKAVYLTIPGEDLHLGLPIQYNLPVINQRRLIREALYLYSKRGTKIGLEGYAEALTGYIPTAIVSPNLLLSVQDSTFYLPLGDYSEANSMSNWYFGTSPGTPSGSVITMEVSTEEAAAPGDNVIDETRTCKVVTNSVVTQWSMTLGVPTSTMNDNIPVTEGNEYTASFKVKSPPSSGDIQIGLLFYDGKGNQLSMNIGSAVAANNTWKTASVTATAPTGALYAGLTIYSDDYGTYYIDQVCMQLGAVVDYYEARAVDLYLLPKKQNYIHNPSFEIDASTWTVTGATFSQNTSVPFDGYSGAYSGKFVAAGAWSVKTNYHVDVDPGTYFSFSTYIKSPTLTTVNLVVKTYTSSNVLLDTYTEPVDVTTGWGRVHTSHLVASDSLEDYAICSIEGAAGTVYLDMVQFEDTSVPTDYFDGSMPSNFGVIWEGTAHASNSYLYPSKPTKMTRLAHTMVDWVPMNTWWRITTPAGVEYTVLDV